MYGWSRIDEGFHEEVDKFIAAGKKHASTLRYNKDTIICPCKDCKNYIAFADVDTIKLHLVMQGFISDYTVWIHHGETTVVDDDNSIDQDEDALLCQYTNEIDEDMGYDPGNKQGGGFGNQPCANGASGASVDRGAREGDEDNGDRLEDMLRAIGPEILLQKRDLQNLERVKTASKETVYGVEKGCPTYWTLLHFVLELLILKAKYDWSNCSFNDLLSLLSRVLPLPNKVPTNTYHAKNVINPLTMGVKKIHACPNHCILFSW
jgi:hypothetical protein